MRPFSVLLFLSPLLGTRAFSLDSRGSGLRRLDVRSTTDVCASVMDSELRVDISTISVPVISLRSPSFSYLVGKIEDTACLCHAGVPNYVQNNQLGKEAASIVGQAQAITDVTSLIDNSPSASNCVYPDNSIAACSAQNLCGFTCTNGFQASPADQPTTCACNAPSVICNGKCVASGLCPSGQAVINLKRSRVGIDSCTQMGPAWATCGVLGGGPRAWECINIASDLESCGGCTYPLTAYSPIGKDCSTLPGVADVSCLSGECVVRRCLPGYVPGFGGTSCIRTHPASQSQFGNPEDVPARVYGLEHVPLRRH